jgi:hypothetical protein
LLLHEIAGLRFFLMSGQKESLVKNSASLVAAICAVFAVSMAEAETAAPRHHHQGRHPTHAAPTPSVRRSLPPAQSGSSQGKPYAHPGEGDNDGLSRDPDDCMKGCIGGNPG